MNENKICFIRKLHLFNFDHILFFVNFYDYIVIKSTQYFLKVFYAYI